MKRLKFLLLIVTSVVSFGSTQLLNSAEETPRPEDKAQIQQFFTKYTEAVSNKDADLAASFWSPTAIYINPNTGVSFQGREEILEDFRKRFSSEKIDKLIVTVHNILMSQPDSALVEGTFKITYQNEKPPFQNAFRAVLTKVDNQWLLQEVRQIQLDQTSTNYTHLKDLEWLIGTWVDSDKDVSIETNTEWDRFKNFLIQKFDMKLYGQSTLEGKQLIAWDPIQKQIRSWVFDSNGGFGEGIWKKEGDTWSVNMNYTLADGRRASSTNIYSGIGPDSYTWTSQNRDVNGEVLPNIEPIKVERK